MKKTRLAFLQSGVEKKLFSIEERKNGDITIGIPSHGVIGPGGGLRTDVISRHVSLHLSRNSPQPIRTITHKICYRDGEPHSGEAKVRNDPGHPFIWPVFIQMVGKDIMPLGNGASNNQEIVRLMAYNCDESTLFCGCFVTSPNLSIKNAHGLSVECFSYEHFNLVFIWTFAHIKCLQNNRELFFYTSPPRGSLGPLMHFMNAPAPPLDPNKLEIGLLYYYQSIGQILFNNPFIIVKSFVDIKFWRFPSFPSGATVSEIFYGDHRSVGNARRNLPTARIGQVPLFNAPFSV